MLRAVFMGSDRFSVPVLQRLLDAGPSLSPSVQVAAVVTQPDRPAGRGRTLETGPVKRLAESVGIPVLQPERLRAIDDVTAVQSYEPRLLVVASYGQIIPAAVLDYPRHGSLNIHPSLLPAFRGPSPIVSAILAGDAITGVTLMLMTEKVDAGPVIAQQRLEIGADESAGHLSMRLADLGAALLVQELPNWIEEKLSPVPQDDTLATFTKRIAKDDGRIDWTLPAAAISRQVCAYNPWPGSFTTWRDRRLEILRAMQREGQSEPGLVTTGPDLIEIGTGRGLLKVEELQLAGGKAQTAGEFLRGRPSIAEARLGS
ncbi:MAG: methionyl-tRNA formyltransferase [Chloroflexota bacterium]